MSIEDLKTTVKDSEDISELRNTLIELTELSGHTYKSVAMSDTIIEQTELKAKLTLINTLRDVCGQRIEELANEQNRLNYNFRMAAKSMLKNETYLSICNMANFKRRDVKAVKTKLKNNPLE